MVVSRSNFGEEAFWFFGYSYKAGIPQALFLIPAKNKQMRAWAENGLVRRWFYSTDKGEVPILPDEIIHFRDWNPWNEIRGVTPLISLSQKIEQDQRANSATTKLLRNNAFPEWILKTDQVLREEALISVYGGILENKDADRRRVFEKLVKACIFYGTREIHEKLEAGNEFTPYYTNRAANEAVSEWSRGAGELKKSSTPVLRQEHPNLSILWNRVVYGWNSLSKRVLVLVQKPA